MSDLASRHPIVSRPVPNGRRRLSILLALALMLAGTIPRLNHAQDDTAADLAAGWPREIITGETIVTLYQPQLEGLEGDALTGRAAVSVKMTPESDPVFGAVWITSRVEADRENRIVYINDIRVPRVRFPNASLEDEARLSELLESEFPNWDLSLSMDRLAASLELLEKEQAASEQLGTAPPKILFETAETVLVTLDGEPKLSAMDNSTLMQVANSPFLMVLDTGTGAYYLYAGKDAWYAAEDVHGQWKFLSNVPAEVAAIAPPEEEPDPDDGERGERTIPLVIVVTEPTELIFTTGEPEYSPIAGTNLLYVSNTDSNVFMAIESQTHFVELSGRWYTTTSLSSGPWEYVASADLPDDFRNIPEDSDVAEVRAFVAGTQEATDAVMDAQIPQTAKVQRGPADIEVTYDGTPQFESVEGTSLQFAVNASGTVLKSNDRYWVAEAGVWYSGPSPMGAWEVATERPPGVENIPPESPVYNVKYVYIYDVTPEVVYVGYTPSYTGTYIYGGCVVYGTGYYYPGWWGRYYYPRPATWGFSVRYNPWTGWSFGITFSRGWFTFGIGVGHRGWWGPAGYHGYRRGYNRGFYHGYRAGYRAGQRQNIYQNRPKPGVTPARPSNRPADGPNAGTRPGTRPETRPSTGNERPSAGNNPSVARDKANNVYADRDGNVFQRGDDGTWNNLAGSGGDRAGAGDRGSAGQPSTGERPSQGTRPSTGQQPSTGSRPSTGNQAGASPYSGNRSSSGSSSLNRDYQSRQHGSNRTNSYNRSRSSSAGRSRGGGGRRR